MQMSAASKVKVDSMTNHGHGGLQGARLLRVLQVVRQSPAVSTRLSRRLSGMCQIRSYHMSSSHTRLIKCLTLKGWVHGCVCQR